MSSDMEDYPEWDASDKKGSFMKINDMLMKEVTIVSITHNNTHNSYFVGSFIK